MTHPQRTGGRHRGLAHPDPNRESGERHRDENVVPPALYRVVIGSCDTVHDSGGWERVEWALDIVGPLGAYGALKITDHVATPDTFEQLRREFAVLGVAIEAYRDIEAARQLVAGKSAFIEVLPSMDPVNDIRVHSQQLATSHHLAVPGGGSLTRAEAQARFNVMDSPIEDQRIISGRFADDPADGEPVSG